MSAQKEQLPSDQRTMNNSKRTKEPDLYAHFSIVTESQTCMYVQSRECLYK